MDAGTRWSELMEYPEADLPLDEAALIISARGNPTVEVASQLRRLDDLAADAASPDTSAVCDLLFGQMGLHGDRHHYDDPRNSYIDQVLDRRRGIPISLSVILIEVGRRCGLHLEGIGMPGHFLVRDPVRPELLIDTFAGGRRLDRSSCQRLLRSVTGAGTELAPEMLTAVGPRAILARMLANLDRSFERRADRRSLMWVSDLRLRMPELPSGDRLQLAARLAGLGRFDGAAALLDGVADGEAEGDLTTRLRAEAITLRARLN